MVAFVAALFIATPAAASHITEDGLCYYPRAGSLAIFLNNNPGARLIGYWHDADAQDSIRVYNEFPKKTDIVGDEVLVYGRSDWRNVYFIVIHENCISAASQIPLGAYRLWVRGLPQEAS